MRMSPDGATVVSGGDEGAVLVWRMPEVVVERDGKRVQRVDLREASRTLVRGRKREEEKEAQVVPPQRQNSKHVMHVRK